MPEPHSSWLPSCPSSSSLNSLACGVLSVAGSPLLPRLEAALTFLSQVRHCEPHHRGNEFSSILVFEAEGGKKAVST